MRKKQHEFTSESVSSGHPDKVADQISDAILDAYLTQDPFAKVACECLITTNELTIAGEVSSRAQVDVLGVARQVLDRIGYHNEAVGFDWRRANLRNIMHTQSPEINQSVQDGGAGDQGIMFGYACDETPELMPLPIVLAHKIVKKLEELRKTGEVSWLRPDAKSQVTVAYEGHVPKTVTKVVVSTQHEPFVQQSAVHNMVISRVLEPLLKEWIGALEPEYIINPSGSFVVGGPHGDTGLTGRKIIVDTYGGSCPHGGGAFSGKDPSKVDRSAAYAARYIAKHLVVAGLVKKCNVQLSYAIGRVEPTSVYVDALGTETCDLAALEGAVRRLFPITPEGIIEAFGLRQPIYQPTATYGHFGNEEFPWEKIDPEKVDALKEEFLSKSTEMNREEIIRMNTLYQRNAGKFFLMHTGTRFTLEDIRDGVVYIKGELTQEYLDKKKSYEEIGVNIAGGYAHINPEIAACERYVLRLIWAKTKIRIAEVGGLIKDLINNDERS